MLSITNTSLKPKTYSWLRLSMVTSLVCGLEFCASVALSYVPSMLLKAGLIEQQMTLIMGLGPFFGFFFCPIIGRISDNCHSPFGKRKPFIFTLSCAILLSLSLIYYSQILLFNEIPMDPNLAHMQRQKSFLNVALLVFACVLLDFSSQASFNPIESLLLDMCQGTDREHTCFTMYSIMNSLGGCLGYLITAISWNTVYAIIFKSEVKKFVTNDIYDAAEKDLNQERSVFSILGFLYAIFASATLFSAKDTVNKVIERERLDSIEESEAGNRLLNSNENLNNYKYNNNGTSLSDLRSNFSLIQCLKSLKCIRHIFKLSFMISLFKMPDALKRLAFADCTSWTAVMCFRLFYMDYVGQIVYEGNPSAPPGTIERVLYDEGIRAASWGLLYHCVVGMIYACFINKLSAKFGLVNTFAMSIFTFTISTVIMLCSKDIILVNIMASITGIGFAALTTIPYCLVTLYHSNKKVYYSDLSNSGMDRGVGGDMAMLDSAYFSSQIILSLTISYIVHITGTVRCYMYTAGIISVIGIYCIKRIKMQ